MALTVVYDACVLYPAPLRDLLVRLARAYLFQAKWTDEIHAEWMRNVLEARSDLSPQRLARTRDLMDRAVPDCLVTGYEGRISALRLPDPDDRHVVAAAIHCNANLIVTFNRRDFPDHCLEPFGIRVQSPDEFVLGLLELSPGVVCRTLAEQRRALRNPEVSADQLLATLAQQGLPLTVSELRKLPELIW